MDEEKKGFIKERIKKKPFDRKLFMMRTGLVVLLGVLFGLVSAISYTAGVYHLERSVYREPVKEVVLGEPAAETPDTGETVTLGGGEEQAEKEDKAEASAEPVVPFKDGIPEYEAVYASLYDIAQSAADSLLTVYALKQEGGWFKKDVESSGQGTGLIIADNRRELLILVDRDIISGAQKIQVGLPDGKKADAVEKKYDPNINLSIIGVELGDISDEAKALIKPAQIGTSSGSRLLGKNVIAVGAPLGVADSISYGVVTSCTKVLQKRDTDVQLLTTDMYGSTAGNGILIDLKGRTVGIITRDEEDSSLRNLICAYGISDVRDSIERMANGQDKAYLGVYGIDVTEDAMERLQIPQGAYVTQVEIDSPAMSCGMQSGDVVTMVGTNSIGSFGDLKTAINNSHPGDETVITVMRQSMGGYSEMTFEVTLGALK